MFLVLARKHFLRFSRQELHVIDMIQLRILSGIDNGIRNDFYPVHLLCIRCQKQRYGSRPAVQVPYDFFPCQLCV